MKQLRGIRPGHSPGNITRMREDFLKQYDVVLNRHILNVFRSHPSGPGHPHDHRAVKIIAGEVARLRLDSLQGQADGIQILFDKQQLPMYFWFGPDTEREKIAFRMVYGKTPVTVTEWFPLKDINSDFLINLIARKFGECHSLH